MADLSNFIIMRFLSELIPKIKLILLSVLFFLGFTCQNGFAVHYSLIGGTYLSDTSQIVWDASLFFNQQWGLRYTVIPEFEYHNKNSLTRTDNSVSNYTITGEYKATSLVYLLDYQTISSTEPGPFDFITAYVSVGYAEQNITIEENRYTASGNNIDKTTHESSTKTPVTSAAFGFYGGEKFMVFDTSIRYLRGAIDDKEAIVEKIEFEHWLISASIGFGF